LNDPEVSAAKASDMHTIKTADTARDTIDLFI
jgi:hypothetical protein